MKLNDIIALAKSGYKVSEIKELLALGEEPAAEDAAIENDKNLGGAAAPEVPEVDEGAAINEIKNAAGNDKEEIDYKAKYEALLDENRKRAATSDISSKEDNTSAEDLVNNAFRNLL